MIFGFQSFGIQIISGLDCFRLVFLLVWVFEFSSKLRSDRVWFELFQQVLGLGLYSTYERKGRERGLAAAACFLLVKFGIFFFC